MNYRLVANQVGDMLKYATTVNEIDRAAKSVFNFQLETFPNEAITSTRAQLFHDWVLSLAKQKMTNDQRNGLLGQFINLITPEQSLLDVTKILVVAGIQPDSNTQQLQVFMGRNFHPAIHLHCRKLFSQQNYFHAVFEAAKAYNKLVGQKSMSQKDGTSLMLDVLSTNGVLKLNTGTTQTEKDVQDGIKFLSAGLMQALRNPTAHEPAIDWPISKEDCLDMLSFISYLFRQLDKTTYYKGTS